MSEFRITFKWFFLYPVLPTLTSYSFFHTILVHAPGYPSFPNQCLLRHTNGPIFPIPFSWYFLPPSGSTIWVWLFCPFLRPPFDVFSPYDCTTDSYTQFHVLSCSICSSYIVTQLTHFVSLCSFSLVVLRYLPVCTCGLSLSKRNGTWYKVLL